MKGAMTTQNLKEKTKKNTIVKVAFSSIVILGISQFLFFNPFLLQSTIADTLSNNNYSIDVGDIDTNPQPTTKPPQQVLGSQSPKPEFTTGPNYTATPSNDSFSVQLSQNLIDYGILSSTNPVIRTSDISLSDPTFGGEILAYENHPLQSVKNDVIQNTTCDNGECNQETAAQWNNTLTFGFGYRCDSEDPTACDPQLSTSNYFKQFSNDSSNQPFEPTVINSAHDSTVNATITYKVNISGTQKSTAYYNNITYLAVPNF